MPYLTRIQIKHLRHLSGLSIDLTPMPKQAFSHLVLTGPNGSGKTTLLSAIAQECVMSTQGQFSNLKSLEAALLRNIEQLKTPTQLTNANASYLEQQVKSINEQIRSQIQQHPVEVEWGVGGKNGLVYQAFESGDTIFFHAPAQRQLGINSVTGPQKFSFVPRALLPIGGHSVHSVAGHLLQLLVNKKTERTFASEDGDRVVVEQIDAWLERVRRAFGILLEDPALQMRFDRNAWDYTLVRPCDGREFNLHGLSHGHASAIQLFAELLIRVETSQQARGEFLFNPQGVVVIDEIETHLHLRLQETILPFLTQAFPSVQFIVATHSPAIVASIPNAVVLDLEKQKTERSDNMQGVRYGDIATGHFGVRTDYDIDTRRKLDELEALFDKTHRSADEDLQMRSLAGELATKSHNLALDVLLRLKAAEVHGVSGGKQEREND